MRGRGSHEPARHRLVPHRPSRDRAVNTLGANDEALIDLWLAKQGLTPAQVNQVELVVVPPVNEAAALRHGQDAAIITVTLLGLSLNFVLLRIERRLSAWRASA
jgi:hypothetical protein